MELNQINDKVSDIKAYTKQYLKTWAFGIVVVFTSIMYVLYSMVKLQKNNVSPLVLTAAIAISIVCALITKASYGEIGFSLGYNSRFYADELEKYNESCNCCLEYQDRVTDFYIKEEMERKALYRKTVLASQCLRYKDWFDPDGLYIGDSLKRSKLSKIQEKVLAKCIRVKIYVPDMFKEKTRNVENYAKKEKTDNEQRTLTLTKNSITAIVPNIVQILFVPVLTKWSWAAVISGLVTVSIWTITGLLQMYNNYNFVVQTKVTQLRDKKELMSKFVKGCEKGFYTSEIDDHKQLNSTQANGAEKGKNDEKTPIIDPTISS